MMRRPHAPDRLRWRHRLGRLGRLSVSTALALVSILVVTPGVVAEEPLVDCHGVLDCNHRIVCNRNIKRALAAVDNSAPLTFENGSARYTVTAMQQERQDRLRAFVAPTCPVTPPSKPPTWPGLTDRLRRLFAGGPIRESDDEFVRPEFGRPIAPAHVQQLRGRWAGWETARDRKASRVSYEVLDVRNGVLVRACSDKGLVMGNIEKGVLEFPRPEGLMMVTKVRLWWSLPDYQQLAGVSLLELQPGHEVVNGSVWLERAVNYDGSAPASLYACQDREIEELKLKGPTP